MEILNRYGGRGLQATAPPPPPADRRSLNIPPADCLSLLQVAGAFDLLASGRPNSSQVVSRRFRSSAPSISSLQVAKLGLYRLSSLQVVQARRRPGRGHRQQIKLRSRSSAADRTQQHQIELSSKIAKMAAERQQIDLNMTPPVDELDILEEDEQQINPN